MTATSVRAMARSVPVSNLFIGCVFLLVGFDDDDDGDAHPEGFGSRQDDVNFVSDLRCLIRRGKGTIFWEPHDTLTHIIVRDSCPSDLR